MVAVLSFITAALFLSQATAFPAYGTVEARDDADRSASCVGAQPHPGPSNNTSAKLVNDAKHPFIAPGPGDLRGPCPALNSLANHGYLPRNGIVTPGQIVTAVQDGFNMENALAIFITYAAFLVDGNQLTNLISIGAASPLTGPPPPKPALATGLNTPRIFEGDASLSRADAFFGNNYSFNETVYAQFESYSKKFGGGKYNLTAAAELRLARIQNSIAINPKFDFRSPRPFTVYVESAFPLRFFVDGRGPSGALDLAAARSFFQYGRMPNGFFRREGAFGFAEMFPDVVAIFSAHPTQPGYNKGKGNFIVDPTSASLLDAGNPICNLYTSFIETIIKPLYPYPTGPLRKALNVNLQNFFDGVSALGCTQLFPFGQ